MGTIGEFVERRKKTVAVVATALALGGCTVKATGRALPDPNAPSVSATATTTTSRAPETTTTTSTPSTEESTPTYTTETVPSTPKSAEFVGRTICTGAFIHKDSSTRGTLLMSPVVDMAPPNSTVPLPLFVSLQENGGSHFDAAPVYPKDTTTWLDKRNNDMRGGRPPECKEVQTHVVHVTSKESGKTVLAVAGPTIMEGAEIDFSEPGLVEKQDVYSVEFPYESAKELDHLRASIQNN